MIDFGAVNNAIRTCYRVNNAIRTCYRVNNAIRTCYRVNNAMHTCHQRTHGGQKKIYEWLNLVYCAILFIICV